MLLTALQVLFLGCVVVGVGLWSVPAALIVGGLVGVALCEFAGRAAARGDGAGR